MSNASAPELNLLKARMKELSGLQAAAALMYWDQATYLPEGAAEARGEHLATLEKFAHQLSTAPEVGQWLESLSRQNLDEKSNDHFLVKIAREDFDRNSRLPAEFRAEQASHASRSYEAWKKAREANDFSIVSGHMKKTLDLSRKMAEYLREPHHKSMIDPLIEISDKGFNEANLRVLFGELRSRLLPLLEKISAAAPFDDACLREHFPEDKQLAFGENALKKIGYEFSRGRQDKTAHPFMIRFAHSDVRITTRVRENYFGEAFFSTIHEGGHALYELGIDPSLDGTPLAQGASTAVHESQSRLWENLVGRSLPFWEYFYPQLQSTFPNQLGKVSLAKFHKAINRVERSLIRTDADEVTYNLHVMIRFDLECDLLEGRLKIEDLPEAWNERYRSDLGLLPSKLSEGVLQDVHWFHGGIGGYFQGYTIGNVMSGQIYATALKAMPDLEDQFRRGDFATLREWLRTNLHQYGRKFDGPELMKKITGRELAAEDYLRYLETKYSKLLTLA